MIFLGNLAKVFPFYITTNQKPRIHAALDFAYSLFRVTLYRNRHHSETCIQEYSANLVHVLIEMRRTVSPPTTGIREVSKRCEYIWYCQKCTVLFAIDMPLPYPRSPDWLSRQRLSKCTRLMGDFQGRFDASSICRATAN
jgi:hypothetical protein